MKKWINDNPLKWTCALVLDTGANTLPFQVYILSCCCIHAQTHVCSESPWRLRPVSAVMGGQGGAQDVTTWKFEKGIKKIRWNQLLLLTPVAPHDKTLTLNHSDHLRGVRFKLVPICGSLYGSPGVTEVLTLLKSLYCFKNGAEALPKNRCVPVFFFFEVDLIQVYVFFCWELTSQLYFFYVPGLTAWGWLKLLTKWFFKTLSSLYFLRNTENWDP